MRERPTARRLLALLLTGSMLVFGGVACDDNSGPDDDTRIGPGDGEDETGPGR